MQARGLVIVTIIFDNRKASRKLFQVRVVSNEQEPKQTILYGLPDLFKCSVF